MPLLVLTAKDLQIESIHREGGTYIMVAACISIRVKDAVFEFVHADAPGIRLWHIDQYNVVTGELIASSCKCKPLGSLS